MMWPSMKNGANAALTPLLALFLTFFLTIFGGVHTAQASDPAVHILAITDFHGALEERGKDVGLARLTGAINAYKATHPHTLLVAVGDLFTGSVESDLLRGAPVLEGLKAAGLVCSAVGNHEFDWGRENLALWRKQGLPFVSANILDAAGRPPAGVTPWEMYEEGGVKIAFVGLTTTSTPRITEPESVRGLEFPPPAQALETAVQAVRAQGAQAVIVLAHLASPSKNTDWPDGIAPSVRQLAEVPGVNAVIYGHSHEEHISRIGQVPVIQPNYRGRSLAVLTLRRDAAAPGGVAVTAELDRLSPRKAQLPVDAAAAQVVRAARTKTGPLLDGTVGSTTRALAPDDTAPSLLGEVVCDSMRAATGADVALLNGGSLRGDLQPGPITLRDLYRILPYENTLHVLRLNGAELRRALEHGIIAPGDEHEPGRFVQASGVRVVYDLSRPKGQRIVSLSLPDGTPVTRNTPLRVAVNSFMSKGGDGFPLAKVGRGKENTRVAQRDALATYIKEIRTLRPEPKGWLRPQ